MFTGLIQSVGTLRAFRPIPGGKALVIAHDLPDALSGGASVAVNGVCLTVTEVRDGLFSAECYFETLKKTTLGRLRPGARINLERALGMDGFLEGHLVQGHVSEVVRVLGRILRGRGAELIVSLPREDRGGLIREGSVALDGVSLTIADLRPDSLAVQLIGETLDRTTLGETRPGDPVNLEADVLLRARQQDSPEKKKETITMGRLAQWGYV